LKAVARKSFRHGFALTEQELRRLLDVLLQQMKRIAATRDPLVEFELDFRNGVTAQARSLDEVLSLENAGSGTVTCLKIMLRDKEDEEEATNEIYIEFTDVKAEDFAFESRSVRYVVKGEDRSWVFVTSSELEERVNRIKVFAPGRFLGAQIVFMAVSLIFVVSVFAATLRVATQKDQLKLAAIEKVEEAYRRGVIKDPLEAVIMLEKESLKALPTINLIKRPILIAGGLFLFFVALWLFTNRLFPACNFCWGDYLNLYERKLAIRRYILIAVITGIIVSVIGGFIVNRVSPGAVSGSVPDRPGPHAPVE